VLGVVGTPGGYGGAVLGLGVAITLHDLFTKASYRIQRRMQALEKQNTGFVRSFRASLGQLTAGVTVAAAGIAGLATLSYPVKSAIEFQNSLALTFSIFDEGQRKMLGGFDGFRSQMEDLAAIFPQTANELTQVYDDIVRADIAPELAFGFVEVGSKLAIANDTPLMDSVNAIISFAQAFGMGIDEDLGPDISKARMYRVADILTAAMDKGRFSDTSLTDFTQVAKYMGQGLAMATGVGLTPEEFMAAWASATMVGQPARRAGTGIRQMMTNILQKTGSTQLGNFMEHAMSEFGYDMSGRDGGIDMAAFIRTEGLGAFLEAARSYAGAGVGFDEAMSSELVQQQLEDIFQAYDEELISEAKLLEKLDGIIGGQLDVAKLMELVPSVWGLAAFLPLVTSQFEGYQETLEYIQNSEDLLESRFQELMATVQNLWARLTSQMNTLVNIWVFPLLDDIGNVLSKLISLVDHLIAFSRRFEPIITIIVRVFALTSMLLTTVGIFISAIAAWRVASGLFYTGLLTLSEGSSIAARTIGRLVSVLGVGALGKVIVVVLAVAAAITALTYAWNTNMFGFRDWFLTLTGQLEPMKKAFSEVFSTLTDGVGQISTDTYMTLQRLGLWDYTLALMGLVYRVRELFRGIGDGLRGIGNAISSAWSWVLDKMGKLEGKFDWLDNLMRTLRMWHPDNVKTWYAWGKAIAYVLIPLVAVRRIFRLFSGLLGGATGVVRTAVNVFGLFGRVLGGLGRIMYGFFLRLSAFLLSNPVGWILIAAAGLIWAYHNIDWVKKGLDDVWEGLKKTGRGIKEVAQGLEDGDLDRALGGVEESFDGMNQTIEGANSLFGNFMGWLGKYTTVAAEWVGLGHLFNEMMSPEEVEQWWKDTFNNLTKGSKKAMSQFENVAKSGVSLIHAMLGGDPIEVVRQARELDKAWRGMWDYFYETFPKTSNLILGVADWFIAMGEGINNAWEATKNWWTDTVSSPFKRGLERVGQWGKSAGASLEVGFNESMGWLEDNVPFMHTLLVGLWDAFENDAEETMRRVREFTDPWLNPIRELFDRMDSWFGPDLEVDQPVWQGSYYALAVGQSYASQGGSIDGSGTPTTPVDSDLSRALTSAATRAGMDTSQLYDLLLETALRGDSDGGANITDAEFSELTSLLEEYIRVNDGRPIELRLDGRAIASAVAGDFFNSGLMSGSGRVPSGGR